MALRNSYPVILEVWEEWGKLTGRHYHPMETYRMDDAKVALLTMGSFGEVAMDAVDRMRGKGIPVGPSETQALASVPLRGYTQGRAGAGDAGGDGPGDLHGRNRWAGGLGDEIGPLRAGQTAQDHQLHRRPGRPRRAPEHFEEMIDQALKLKGKRRSKEFYTIGSGIIQDTGVRIQESGFRNQEENTTFVPES